MKRKADNVKGTLSPPPLKKKVESTTNRKAVANFFKPASQKEPEKLVWRIVNDSLLVGKYVATSVVKPYVPKQKKIAAFDFDSTLIKTSSGNVFGKDASDWRWWDPCVPKRLKLLESEGYTIVILSNQSGITLNQKNDSKPAKGEPKRLADFKTKVGYVFNQLDISITIYAATMKDRYRKPRTGMWLELLEDYDLDEAIGPELERSFFVGDAAGRDARKVIKADHSCSDRDFAANVGIEFKTPEEYFLDEKPHSFKRLFDPFQYINDAQKNGSTNGQPFSDMPVISKVNPLDIILLCGSPGSGKSTLYWDCLEPLGYARVNQDILKTREKCIKVATEHLSAKKSVVVDNTNADTQTRESWVQFAKRMEVPIRCIRVETPPEVCKHNDAFRGLNEGVFNPENRTILPGMAFTGFVSRYREPVVEEGFQDIVRVPFRFRGDEHRWALWSKYWN